MATLSRALLAAALLLPSAAAQADCAYEMQQVKSRALHETDRVKALAIQRELKKAEDARKTSETECRNNVTRAWRLLKAEPAPAKNPAKEAEEKRPPQVRY
jgi:hypothetical protein